MSGGVKNALQQTKTNSERRKFWRISWQVFCLTAPIPDFTDTSSIKYCCLIYLQVQVPIPIHGSTIECAVKINSVLV